MFLSLCKEQGTEKFLNGDFSQFENMMCRSDSILKGVLAKSNNKYVGMILYFLGASPYKAAPFLVFKGLYVDPLHRKKGIAVTLMREIHKRAIEERCTSIKWNVLKENKGAVYYYENLGFSSDPDPLLEYTETPDAFIRQIEHKKSF